MGVRAVAEAFDYYSTLAYPKDERRPSRPFPDPAVRPVSPPCPPLTCQTPVARVEALEIINNNFN